MKIEIKKFYKEQSKVDKNYNIEVARCFIDLEAIRSYLERNIVKFVFFDSKYADISSDTSINEIHKFKSKYRGNTYIRKPLSIVKDENEYVKGIVVTEDTNMADGYVVVSKHDLHDIYKHMRYTSKDKRIAFGTKLCDDALLELNNILNGDVFKVIIKDSKRESILYEEIIFQKLEVVNGKILEVIQNLEQTNLIGIQ